MYYVLNFIRPLGVGRPIGPCLVRSYAKMIAYENKSLMNFSTPVCMLTNCIFDMLSVSQNNSEKSFTFTFAIISKINSLS